MDRSSDSDEESVRHDRFRSERYHEESKKESRPRGEVRKRHSDVRSTRKSRERSLLRNHRRPHEARSSPTSRRRQRSNHERKSRERDSRDSRQKSSSGNSDEWAKFSKKIADKQKTEMKDTPSKKKCLSSLLKSFDEKVDAKRQSESVLGPALPSHMLKAGGSSVERLDTDSSHNSGVHSGSKEVALKDDDDLELLSKQSESDVSNPTSPSRSQENIDDKNSATAILDCPALPSHLLRKSEYLENPLKVLSSLESSGEPTHTMEKNTLTEDHIRPVQPKEEITEAYGPALPPKVEVDSYGPALPPCLKKSSVQGPSLPEGLTLEEIQEENAEEDDDEETVGPLPGGKMTATQFQLELRAAQIKQQLEHERNGSKEEVKQREEWMLELPSGKASNLGLGPRSFRKREAPDMSDRSSWTDTPADRQRKEEMAASGESELIPADSEETMRLAMVKERDAAMDELSQRSHEDNRPQTLLEMHQKKLSKKKKKQEKEEREGKKKKERRPFDRNVDLQVNRFDEAQKKAIFKKAQLLDTRFSTGESKYL